MIFSDFDGYVSRKGAKKQGRKTTRSNISYIISIEKYEIWSLGD
jgi:hypothetical protein